MGCSSSPARRLVALEGDGVSGPAAWRSWRAPPAIDADLLERLARIARGLPGHVVSVDAEDCGEVERWSRQVPDDTTDPVVRIDGVVARHILEHYQQLLDLG
jgi:hypothetical protein